MVKNDTTDTILVVHHPPLRVETRQGKRKETEMLVLSRKKDETIIMRIPGHEDIKLTVVRIDNMNKVRIGVEADKEVVILRSELEANKEVPAT